MTISTKKQFSCRISNNSYDFLKNLSLSEGFNHPLSKDLPNISKTLDIIISKIIIRQSEDDNFLKNLLTPDNSSNYER